MKNVKILLFYYNLFVLGGLPKPPILLNFSELEKYLHPNKF